MNVICKKYESNKDNKNVTAINFNKCKKCDWNMNMIKIQMY